MQQKALTKKGMTLVEAIMAIGVLVAGMGIFTLLFVRSWEMHRFAFDEADAQFVASQGLSRMVDTIRNARRGDNGAFPLVSASENEMIFYGDADDDSDVERIRFALSGASIVQEIRNPTDDIPPSYASGYESSTEIASHLVDTDTHPVFTYYDDANNELSGVFSVSSMKMVKVVISVDTNPNRPPEAITMESYAAIRNLNEHDSAL
jgi:hypothetical protein